MNILGCLTARGSFYPYGDRQIPRELWSKTKDRLKGKPRGWYLFTEDGKLRYCKDREKFLRLAKKYTQG